LDKKIRNIVMKEIGNIVSICDGMSCGQIAVNRAGLKYDKYYMLGNGWEVDVISYILSYL